MNRESTHPCRCHPTKKRSWNRGRWISYFSEEYFQHKPDCPRFAYSDFSKSVEARFVTCTRFLRLCVHIGLYYGFNDGFKTVSPILRYRNVVPKAYGAFKPIAEASGQLRRFSWKFSQSQLIDLLANVTSATRQMFGKTASPMDLNEVEGSLLHVS
jgi:hypothetical protein